MTALHPGAARPAAPFAIPPGAEASAPAERRGLAREGVRLLVARPGGVEHRRFHQLGDVLRAGDVLVINTSATLPAALVGELDGGGAAPVHLSTVLDDGTWVVEVRLADGAGPDLTRQRGETVMLPEAVRLRLDEGYPNPAAANPRLWRAIPSRPVSIAPFLDRNGRPIRYRHLREPFPLADHQTVYAHQPGSAEMASAGRPLTAQLITKLVAAGITFAPVVLHCAVSSPEAHEPPLPERFDVPAATARLVMSARSAGNRVIAVGTTVVRALESASAPCGEVGPARGWTNLVLDQTRPARVVDGLVTGLHAPEASHLLLLEAVAGAALVAAAYEAAVRGGYLWHEFGDSMIFLPD